MQFKSSQKYFVGVLSSLTLIHGVRGKQEAKQEDGIFSPSLLWKTAVGGKERSVLLTFPGSVRLCNKLLTRQTCTSAQCMDVSLLP